VHEIREDAAELGVDLPGQDQDVVDGPPSSSAPGDDTLDAASVAWLREITLFRNDAARQAGPPR
jgi:hypothetical protein